MNAPDVSLTHLNGLLLTRRRRSRPIIVGVVCIVRRRRRRRGAGTDGGVHIHAGHLHMTNPPCCSAFPLTTTHAHNPSKPGLLLSR